MSEWTMVQWSQARQITDLLGVKPPEAPRAGVAPADYFAGLVEAERRRDAVNFLALALPRYEAIAWASDVLGAFGGTDRDLDELRAFEIAREWIRSPSETLRRRAEALASAMDGETPEKHLLMAIFFSGGSIAPEGQPPVHPRDDLTGRLAGAVIVLTALAASDEKAALAEALIIGERLAERAEQ